MVLVTTGEEYVASNQEIIESSAHYWRVLCAGFVGWGCRSLKLLMIDEAKTYFKVDQKRLIPPNAICRHKMISLLNYMGNLQSKMYSITIFHRRYSTCHTKI
jgi:hypothetical protein